VFDQALFQRLFFNVTCIPQQALYIKTLSVTSVTYLHVQYCRDTNFTWRSKIVCLFYYFDKLTELKAEAWEKEKELRQKINQIQKEQAERIENLQVNNFVYRCSSKPSWAWLGSHQIDRGHHCTFKAVGNVFLSSA